MGWVTEDGLHEGYAVAVLADGRDATAADNPGSGNWSWWCFDGKDGRPLAVGVRAGCDCYNGQGRVAKQWRGSAVHPVVFGDDEATEGHDGRSGPYGEWETAHVRPAQGAAVPEDIAALLDAARRRLAQLAAEHPLAALSAVARLEALAEATGRSAAGAAQRGGESWTGIGKALGVSKQAAHQRFARHLGVTAAPGAQEPVA
ncbi:hypothetical protein OG851_42685 (plasmid) [Streptomyces sp. NBC_00161]|uniref:hypothetical protein n=1 Tax=Streptomyces sp. NBC_00161 TaxID=2975671 RepID=UPI002F90EBE6